MKDLHLILLAMLGAIFVALGNSLGATAATAPSAAGYTQLDYYREMLDFDHAEFVKAYESGSRRNAKWDAAATAALEMFVVYDAQNCADGVACLASYPERHITDEEMQVAAQKALDLGCDDPLVLYAEAVALINDGQTSRGREALDKSAASIAGTSYSAVRQCRILNRQRQLAEDDAVRGRLWREVVKLCGQIAGTKFPNAASHREAARTLSWAIGDVSPEQAEEALGIISSARGADAWVVDIVIAQTQIGRAWEARGADWAQNTRADQMQGFQKDMDVAAAAAKAAYQLQPTFPEGATAMITVAMGDGNADQALQWFGRAKEGEADYEAAYAAIFSALQPRWGGTTQQSMAVGLEAADTKRYDTSIPFEYILAACNVATDDAGGDKAKFKDPQVQQRCRDILGEYIKQAQHPAQVDYTRACLAALDVVNRQMEPARQLLDQIQGDPDPGAFRLFNLFAPLAIDDVYLSTLPDKEGVANYRRASSRHFYKNAEKFLDVLLKRDAPTGRTMAIVQRLKNGTELMQSYPANKPISLIDEKGRGFWENEVPYKTDATGIITTADSGFLLHSRFPLPDRHYVIHMTFTFEDPAGAKLHGQFASLAWGLNWNSVGWSVVLRSSPAGVEAQAPSTKAQDVNKTYPLAIGATNQIDIRYESAVPVVTVNGTAVPMGFGDQGVLGQFKPLNRLDVRSTAAIHITGLTIERLAGAAGKADETETTPASP